VGLEPTSMLSDLMAGMRPRAGAVRRGR
jgi:hypothetical protein